MVEVLDQQFVYTHIQSLLQNGLVLIVGSGASCAYGLPGMGKLADHVLEHVPAGLSTLGTPPLPAEWETIEAKLVSGSGLESALAEGLQTHSLGELIAQVVGECVAAFEGDAIAKILTDPYVSSFGNLFNELLRVTNTLDVITTNYDRLIEVHAARAALPIDSMYYGHTIGRLSAQKSRHELWDVQDVPGRAKRVQQAVTRPHIRISKPHGSLDWYSHGNVHYRTDLPFPGARRIIAPGGDKYRLGYDQPFDTQRERANRAIDNAAALLFIGYGFNDEHLQTHLGPRLNHIPSVVMARNLTDAAKFYLEKNPESLGIQIGPGDQGCSIQQGDSSIQLDESLWDLDVVMKEVFGL